MHHYYLFYFILILYIYAQHVGPYAQHVPFVYVAAALKNENIKLEKKFSAKKKYCSAAIAWRILYELELMCLSLKPVFALGY